MSKIALTKSSEYELNGTMLTVYHRTKDKEVAGHICNIGFMVGGGAAYGAGIYSTFTLKSSLRNYALGYGPEVLKSEMDINGFLIFDYDIAKDIYGNNYKLVDQVNVIGEDKIYNSSRNKEKQKSVLEKASKDLETAKWTSDIASHITNYFDLDSTGLNGVIYTGRSDGRCAVAYKPTLITPLQHAWVDGKTYKNPQWEPCPELSLEALRELRNNEEAATKFIQERKHLLSTIKSLDSRSFINISPQQFPSVPEKIFDELMLGYLYEDETRFNKLSPQLQNKYKDIIEIDFLIRKLRSAPTANWKEFQSVPQSTKDKIPQDLLIEIWTNYIDKSKGHWEQIPPDIRSFIPKSGEAEYWAKKIKKNPINWKYVPKEIFEYIRDEGMLKVPDNIEEIKGQVPEGAEPTDFLQETEEIDIPKGAIAWVQDEINTMNNRAGTLGLPPIILSVLDEDRKEQTLKIKITGSLPILKGWKLIARVNIVKVPINANVASAVITPPADAQDAQPDQTEEMRMVEPLTDQPIPPELELETTELRCDHCKHNRRRTEVYVIQYTKTGEYKMIGSTCLGDFIGFFGGRDPQELANYAQTFKQLVHRFAEGSEYEGQDKNQIQGSFKRVGVPLIFFLGKVELLKKMGIGPSKWNPLRQIDLNKASKEAWMWSTSLTHSDYYDDIAKNRNVEITASDITKILNAINWITDYKPSTDPEERKYDPLVPIQEAVKVGSVLRKKHKEDSTVYPAGQLIAYYKEKNPQDIDYKKLMANKGATVFFKGQLISRKPLFLEIVQQGKNVNITKEYCVAEDSGGKRVAWYGSITPDIKKGQQVSIRGIVENFIVIEGEAATSLKEVSLVDDQEVDKNKNAMDEQNKNFQKQYAWKAYRKGQSIEDDFTITDFDINYNTYKAVNSQDVRFIIYGDDVIDNIQLGKINDKVRLKGIVDVNRYSDSLYLTKVEKLKTYNDGDVFEDNFTIINSVPSGDKLRRYYLQDSSKVPFTTDNTDLSIGNIGDVVKLKGIIKVLENDATSQKEYVLTQIQTAPKIAPEQAKKDYQEGESVEDNFTIQYTDFHSYHKKYYVLINSSGNKFSAFTDKNLGLSGQVVRLKGIVSKTVSRGKTYVNLTKIEVISGSTQQPTPPTPPTPATTATPKPYFAGQVIEDNFTITNIQPAYYGSKKYTLKDSSGRTITSFSKLVLGNLNQNVRLKGIIQIKGPYINLTNPTTVSSAPTTPPVTSSSINWLSLEDINDQSIKHSGGFNWFKKYKIAQAIDAALPVSSDLPQGDNQQVKKHKTYQEIDVDKAYSQFSDSYQKATGKSWDKNKFINKSSGWIFYGDDNGYIAVRPQGSGLYKLVGVAGNPKSILKGFEDLMSENKPTWGMVSAEIKDIITRKGFISAPGFITKFLTDQVPPQVLGNAIIKNVDLKGEVILEYPDIGTATKYFVANKEYYRKLQEYIKNKTISVPSTVMSMLISWFGKMGF